ncbi:DNA adenine methylase [Brevibacillus agri]|uniref:DNA adenine methylase n=1 Tax=Brevibacillus agri TaxID=51101 RepID=UPI0028706858|nr:DNA adenine methylase [Brevibacillus agri]MDR9504739.1 DNA adenine methylase [Brevibacillus agri]
MGAKSPLIWFGGKATILGHILELIEQVDHDTYNEPFGGSARVIAEKPPGKVDVYNDINDDAVNFLMVVNEDPERFYQAVKKLPYSRSLFEQWQEELFHYRRRGGYISNFDRAVRFFYVNRLGIYGGGLNHKSGFKHSPKHNSPKSYQGVCERIHEFADRMRLVIIERHDFRDNIKTYDTPRTLHYVDPPYVGSEHRYPGDFDENDHRDLAKLLNKAKGKVILSYYDCDLVRELYPGWYRKEIKAKKNTVVSGEGYTRPDATELLLMNYKPMEQSLFEYGT